MKATPPRWTVIVPTYNRAPLLDHCIQSVIAQTCEDWELIVVDDCSTDGTADLLAALDDDRIKYRRLGENSGAAHARNVGLSAASGDLIAFLDSDDWWEATKLERCDAFARSHLGDTSWFGFLRQTIVRATASDVRPSPRPLSRSVSFAEYLILDGFVQTSAVFGPSEILTSIQFRTDLAPLEDWDYYLRLEAGGVIPELLAEVLGVHRADDRPGRLSRGLSTITAERWLHFHEHSLSARARAGFELLRLAPAMKPSQFVRSRLVALAAGWKLRADVNMSWRPLVAVLLPQFAVEFLARK